MKQAYTGRVAVASILVGVLGFALVAPATGVQASSESRTGSTRYVAQGDNDRNWGNQDWRGQHWNDDNWRKRNWQQWNDDNWRNHNWGHGNWRNVSQWEARRIASNLFFPRKQVIYVATYGQGWNMVYRVYFADGTQVTIRAMDGRILNVRLGAQWHWRQYSWQ